MIASVEGARFVAEKDVVGILSEHGVDPKSIEAVIWSHIHTDHTDHTGDPSTFPASTALVVGPGFAAHHMPGYPADPTSQILESDYTGRELRELHPEDFTCRVGHLAAHDYFGDGSFYVLDAPGHSIGHIMGLARVTSSPDSFILMAGDAAHHGGELRPSPWLPLPAEITPHPFTDSADAPLQTGTVLDAVLPIDSDGKPNRARAFLRPGERTTHHDFEEAARTIDKLQEADAWDKVLVVMAHDNHLMHVLDFFPAKSNDFMEKRLAAKGRGRFLKGLSKAVGWEEDVVGKPKLTK